MHYHVYNYVYNVRRRLMGGDLVERREWNGKVLLLLLILVSQPTTTTTTI